MIPDDRHMNCKRRLDFDYINAMQLQALGKQQDMEIDKKEKAKKDLSPQALSNMFDNGDYKGAMTAIFDMINDLQARILELEENQNGT